MGTPATRTMTAMLLAALSACDSAGPIEMDPAAVLRGRVVMLDGGDPSMLRVRTMWQEEQGEASVSANGGLFLVELEARPSGAGTVVVESVSGAGSHHPAWVPLRSFALDEELDPRTFAGPAGPVS